MIRIMLVEDELAARRFLRNLIETFFSGRIEICGEYKNGQEALAAIEKHKPDMLISDVYMPVMDGIELTGNIADKYPWIRMLIISGYQEFEYAQGALRNGVRDYLLKPINLQRFQQTIEKLASEISCERDENTRRYLADALSGRKLNIVGWDFALPAYDILAIRLYGLPSLKQLHDCGVDLRDCLSGVRDVLFVPGRDALEVVALTQMLPAVIAERLMEALRDNVPDSWPTIVFSEKPAQVTPERLQEMWRLLDMCITPGYRRILSFTQAESLTAQTFEFTSIQTGYTLNDITRIIAYADARHIPLSRTIAALNDVPRKNAIQWDARTYQTLGESLFKALDASGDNSSDPEAIFRKAVAYIDRNMDKSIALTDVCAVCHISRTYLNRLFRANANAPFGDYLIDRRIERAKRLLSDRPDMPLKDVAQAVGYADPLYFSKAFKLRTGKSPSVYRTELNSGNRR